jgi:hypothetical protein
MNKSEVLGLLAKEWSTFLETAKAVPTESREKPAFIDRWSVAQVLVHIASWDEEVIEIINAYAETGEERDFAADPDINERQLHEKNNMDLPMIWRYLDEAHGALLARLNTLEDKDFDASCYLGDLIASIVHQHYVEHRNDIENVVKA